MTLTAEEMIRHGPETEREKVLMDKIDALMDRVEVLRESLIDSGFDEDLI